MNKNAYATIDFCARRNAQMGMSMNVGIVGSGMIVEDCLKALSEMEQIICTAICVREHSLQQGQALAQQYGIKMVYTDYEDFLEDKNFSIVYIGIINTEHFSFAKKALEAKKHVVLEKPFTIKEEEARLLEAKAKGNNLFLFEAITTLYFPNYDVVRKSIKDIGDVKMIQCNFSQYSSRYDRYLRGEIAPAFDLAAGGGALYDLNVYNIHFVLGLFGPPIEVQYRPNIGHNGVDTSGVLFLGYPTFTAVCTAAKDSSSPHFAVIQGTRGYIKVEGQVSICPSVEVCLEGQVKTHQENRYKHRMQHEWAYFRQCIENKDNNNCYEILAHTVAVMQVLEQSKIGHNKK